MSARRLRSRLVVASLLTALAVGCAQEGPGGAVSATKAADPAKAASSGAPTASQGSLAPPPALPPSVEAPPPAPSGSGSARARARASSSAIGDAFGAGGLGLKGIGEGGGCPCGCDHSEEMTDELRALGGAGALATLDASLRTIGEREDAGYVTERMVKHRLRLLGLKKELGHGATYLRSPVPPVRAGAAVDAGGAKVRAELVLHGDSVEVVNGKEKPLDACFVVRLELESAGGRVTLQAPTLEASVPMPVSRWYVAGTDGAPWDGKLERGERKLVQVIGYTGARVAPGTELAARIHVGSATLDARAKAKKRWDEPSR